MQISNFNIFACAKALTDVSKDNPKTCLWHHINTNLQGLGPESNKVQAAQREALKRFNCKVDGEIFLHDGKAFVFETPEDKEAYEAWEIPFFEEMREVHILKLPLSLVIKEPYHLHMVAPLSIIVDNDK